MPVLKRKKKKPPVRDDADGGDASKDGEEPRSEKDFNNDGGEVDAKEGEEEEEEEGQLGDAVCTVCESGGVLETCDGCVRSWHTQCIAVSLLPGGERIKPGSSRPPDDPDAPWLCDECELRIHRCFLCKHYARDEGLWRCSATASCSKFYHQSCLRRWYQNLGLKLGPGQDASLCPRHHFCGAGADCKAVPRSARGADTPAHLEGAWKCIRCPVVYHEQCLPPAVHIVDFGARLFYCMRHTTDSTSKSAPLPESSSLLQGRRRLKLGELPPEANPKPKGFRTMAEAAAAKHNERLDDGGRYGLDAKQKSKGGAKTVKAMRGEPGSLLIMKKKTSSGGSSSSGGGTSDGGDASPSKPAAVRGVVMKGTRMKIRGMGGGGAAASLRVPDLLRAETAAEKRRRLGYTGQMKVGSGAAGRRGSKTRSDVAAWAAQRMKAFLDDGGEASEGASSSASAAPAEAESANADLFPTALALKAAGNARSAQDATDSSVASEHTNISGKKAAASKLKEEAVKEEEEDRDGGGDASIQKKKRTRIDELAERLEASKRGNGRAKSSQKDGEDDEEDDEEDEPLDDDDEEEEEEEDEPLEEVAPPKKNRPFQPIPVFSGNSQFLHMSDGRGNMLPPEQQPYGIYGMQHPSIEQMGMQQQQQQQQQQQLYQQQQQQQQPAIATTQQFWNRSHSSAASQQAGGFNSFNNF